jgi:hypothetical protein
MIRLWKSLKRSTLWRGSKYFFRGGLKFNLDLIGMAVRE